MISLSNLDGDNLLNSNIIVLQILFFLHFHLVVSKFHLGTVPHDIGKHSEGSGSSFEHVAKQSIESKMSP